MTPLTPEHGTAPNAAAYGDGVTKERTSESGRSRTATTEAAEIQQGIPHTTPQASPRRGDRHDKNPHTPGLECGMVEMPDHNTIWRTMTKLREPYLKQLNHEVNRLFKKRRNA